MSFDTAHKRDFLQPPQETKPGFRFSLKATKKDSPPFLRSTPIVMNKNQSLGTPRQPLQHLRINPNSGRRVEPHWAHYNVQRSQTLKGASNLPKETRLLQKKLDCMLTGFHETVVEHDRSQQTRLLQLQGENDKLRKANKELEIENLTYFKELEDCEEHIDEMEKQRKTLTEKLTKSRHDCTVVETLKEENEKLKKRIESFLNELNEYTDLCHQKDCQVQEMQIEIQQLKNKLLANENTSSSIGRNLEK
jgi:chromosome segregation ATPase